LKIWGCKKIHLQPKIIMTDITQILSL